MVQEVKPPLADVKAEAQRVVEQTMEQARSAVDNYFTFVSEDNFIISFWRDRIG
jgi:hypothetical protein